jgi:S1-C subfamily serine protease
MSYVEFRLRGIEKLPSAIKRVKDNVCTILAHNEHKFENLNLDKLSIYMPILYSLQVASKGTGFLTTSGYVVTAFHVVEGYSDIFAITPSQKRIRLDLVKKNEKYDLVLLKPEERWCGGLELQSVADPQLGSLVFSLGYPLNYLSGEPILSVGFLSNVILDENLLENLVVNAPFNVGNSGGPLMNEDGLLLGVVKAKGIMPMPLLKLADEFLEKPGVELVYGSIKIGEWEVEVTLSKVIKALMKWIADNTQTNIGFAIPAKYVREVARD